MPQAIDPKLAAALTILPEATALGLADFILAAQSVFDTDLKSVVLYGSGAEGRLRPASDVNLIVVLRVFSASKAAEIRGPFNSARAAIKLTAMFLLEAEIEAVATAFGQKFSDILRRHRVLYGADPFKGIEIPREAVLWRLKQVLLNLILRLREAYIEQGGSPERTAALIADAAGPLRSCAATLRDLERKSPMAPKEALTAFVTDFGEPGWEPILAHISETREQQVLSASVADQTLFRITELAVRLRARAAALE